MTKKTTVERVHKRYVTIKEGRTLGRLGFRATRLSDCYKNCSVAKQSVYDDCIALFSDIYEIVFKILDNPTFICDYGICGYNSMMFSFGAHFELNGKVICQLYCTHTRTEVNVISEYYDNFVEIAKTLLQ